MSFVRVMNRGCCDCLQVVVYVCVDSHLQKLKGVDLMSRPLKDGVLYFSKDTDFYENGKVKLLRGEFGAKGMYLLDYLLCELYRGKGYFLEWSDERCLLVSDGAVCAGNSAFVAEFVTGCIRRSFFDKRVFDLFGVLTSRSIQERYIRMFKGRDKIYLISEYCLLDMNDEKSVPAGILSRLAFKSNNGTENPDKREENPDKREENETNKNKEKKELYNSFYKEKDGLLPELDAVWNIYKEERKKNFKVAFTSEAEAIALERLNALAPDDISTQIKIVRQSIERGWKGLFPLKKEETIQKSSFDIDEFYAASLARSYGEVKK